MWIFPSKAFSVIDLEFEDESQSTVTLQIKFVTLDVEIYCIDFASRWIWDEI
jgi:hypothetical protein